jgi:hypothetical protein
VRWAKTRRWRDWKAGDAANLCLALGIKPKDLPLLLNRTARTATREDIEGLINMRTNRGYLDRDWAPLCQAISRRIGEKGHERFLKLCVEKLDVGFWTAKGWTRTKAYAQPPLHAKLRLENLALSLGIVLEPLGTEDSSIVNAIKDNIPYRSKNMGTWVPERRPPATY